MRPSTISGARMSFGSSPRSGRRHLKQLASCASESARYCGGHRRTVSLSTTRRERGLMVPLPKQPAVQQHLRALPYRELPAALETIAASAASLSAKYCLRFVVLTAARSGEARFATWDEIDREGRVWRIPGSRMKTGCRTPRTAHRHLPGSSGRSSEYPRWLQPNFPLSGQTAQATVVHDAYPRYYAIPGWPSAQQSTDSAVRFRDWAADNSHPRELAEAALSHVVGGVEGAYFRSDLFDRRRALMNSWARYATQDTAKVVQLRG